MNSGDTRGRERSMGAHDEIRELLGLAAAGALSGTEEQRVASHVASCAACASELEDWRMLAGGLRRLPTPQPRAAIVERARARAQMVFAEEEESRSNGRVMVLLVCFAWIVTLASWPIFRMVSSGLLVWFDPRFNQTWLVFAGFTGLLWATGGLAAVMLARHRQQERRLA
jgi:anti-sigma factor RsiW